MNIILFNVYIYNISVADILSQLDKNCITKYKITQPAKVKLCKDVASVLVQIPPGMPRTFILKNVCEYIFI